MILDDIVAKKQARIAQLKEVHSGSSLEQTARSAPATRDFHGAIRGGTLPAIIAEIKKASPSAGMIRSHFEVTGIAESYERGGAAAISVITEEDFFLGSLDYLHQARDACSLPVLCKDFIIDPIQVYLARGAGADALLLIAAILDDDLLSQLLKTARSLDMACLVEVHDETELARVLATDAPIIGINNRNLKTFEVTLETTVILRPLVPEGRLLVSESGIHNQADVESLGQIGVNAVLVGTSLMSAADPEKKLMELRGRHGS
jgi:indole-3-glycerol phosphate synthase